MRKFPVPCLDCQMLTKNDESRCDVHQKRVDELAAIRRAGVKKATGQYSGDYKKRAKEVRLNAVVCHLCGEGARWGDMWEADHLYPGEPDSPLLPAHRSCNQRRGNKPLL